MNEDVWEPEVLDHVRVDIDLPPGPVRAVVENHPVLWPAHVVAQAQTQFLEKRSTNSVYIDKVDVRDSAIEVKRDRERERVYSESLGFICMLQTRRVKYFDSIQNYAITSTFIIMILVLK